MYVEGAEPGDVLEVKIQPIDLAIDYGYNGCKGVLPENCEPNAPVRIIPLDRHRMTAQFAPGIVIPLRPFFGSMGVAPAPEAGRVSSNPPGRHAGNLDNRELVAGCTLYIPVFARGALFEVGDGHVAQGDGEFDQTAIQEMVDFLVTEKQLTHHEAYQLVSIAGNVAITQLVDKPNVGVHVRLPKSIFVPR